MSFHHQGHFNLGLCGLQLHSLETAHPKMKMESRVKFRNPQTFLERRRKIAKEAVNLF